MDHGRAAPMNIVLAESWSVLRRGVRSLLSTRHAVLVDVETVAELTPALERDHVDVVIIGTQSEGELAAHAATVRSIAPSAFVIALVTDIDAHALAHVLREGVSAVLGKSTDDDELLDAVERVSRGERVIDQRFLPLLFNGELTPTPAPDRAPADGLTPRERDVLQQLAKGGTNREIAASLVLGESTVKTHLASIYGKLEVEGRHRAVWKAIELGILQ